MHAWHAGKPPLASLQPADCLEFVTSESRSSGKVELCHRTESGTYHMIDVSVNAEPAHRAHGDAKVGEPVPGTQKQVFDSSCRPAGPAVNIEKSTNGEDADNAPGPSIPGCSVR
jgi:hypothetical protein